MSKNIKVYKSPSPFYTIVEYRNDSLLFEESFAFQIGVKEKEKLLKKCTKEADLYGCLGVLSLKKDEKCLVGVTSCQSIGKLFDSEIYQITDVTFISLSGNEISSSLTSEIKKLLTSGSFYFASAQSQVANQYQSNFNLTRGLQYQNDVDCNQFCWNRQLLKYFTSRGLQSSKWCINVMCGGISIKTAYLMGGKQARILVISRLSCNRVGTRFNTRGADHDGFVANFVESEQIIIANEKCCSFTQIRGSVPLLWEQPGLNVGSHKVKISLDQNISQSVYDKHMMSLEEKYGKCCIVNLLGGRGGESELTKSFQGHHEKSSYKQTFPLISYDYHAEIRSKKNPSYKTIESLLLPYLEEFGVYLGSSNGESTNQNGVLRVNCLDCLDRTNSLQTYIGVLISAHQLKMIGFNEKEKEKLVEILKQNWQKSGDLISKMYAGTGALDGSKDDKVGRIKDGAKSMTRAIQNNFLDQGKQGAIHQLLKLQIHEDSIHDVNQLFLIRDLLTTPQFLNSSSKILKEIVYRTEEFIEMKKIRVAVGTWNVNGGKQLRLPSCKDQNLTDWLFPLKKSEYCVACFEFSAEQDDDLCFDVGQLIIIDEALEGGDWLRGRKVTDACNLVIDDKSGMFPSAYVKVLTSPHVVLHQFDAEQPDDLQLYEGDIVDVTSQHDDWLNGKIWREDSEITGMFPANHVKNLCPSIDIFALGFEEMVELNAGNIVNTSLTNQKDWEEELLKTIQSETKDEYSLLASEQLVGVCLFVFIRKPLYPHVRDISISTRKTGLGGTTGNKGGVAVSLLLRNTSICFVCSHLAAGQSQVSERNSDYSDISNNLTFAKGRKLFNHDYVFWCGDFNYRIDLPNNTAKQLIIEQNWNELKAYDQLIKEKAQGNVFKGFKEGEIEFAPTYKYDLFSDVYDTSEKCRCPAWTDRVVYWKNNPECQDSTLLEISSSKVDDKIISYTRAELNTSDHRPVMALLDVHLKSVISESERCRVYEEVTNEVEPSHQAVFIHINEQSAFRDDSFYYSFLKHNEIERPNLAKSFPYGVLVAFKENEHYKKITQLDNSVYCNDVMRVSPYTGNLTSEWSEVVEKKVAPPAVTSQKSSEVPARPPLPPPPSIASRPGPPPENSPPQIPPPPLKSATSFSDLSFPEIPSDFGLNDSFGLTTKTVPARPAPPVKPRAKKNENDFGDHNTAAPPQPPKRQKNKRKAPPPPPPKAATKPSTQPVRCAPPKPPTPNTTVKKFQTPPLNRGCQNPVFLPPPPASRRGSKKHGGVAQVSSVESSVHNLIDVPQQEVKSADTLADDFFESLLVSTQPTQMPPALIPTTPLVPTSVPPQNDNSNQFKNSFSTNFADFTFP